MDHQTPHILQLSNLRSILHLTSFHLFLFLLNHDLTICNLTTQNPSPPYATSILPFLFSLTLVCSLIPLRCLRPLCSRHPISTHSTPSALSPFSLLSPLLPLSPISLSLHHFVSALSTLSALTAFSTSFILSPPFLFSPLCPPPYPNSAHPASPLCLQSTALSPLCLRSPLPFHSSAFSIPFAPSALPPLTSFYLRSFVLPVLSPVFPTPPLLFSLSLAISAPSPLHLFLSTPITHTLIHLNLTLSFFPLSAT